MSCINNRNPNSKLRVIEEDDHMRSYDRKDWMHNEMKTGDPAYDGEYHPKHYHCGGSNVRYYYGNRRHY